MTAKSKVKEETKKSEIKGGIEVLIPTFEKTRSDVARTVKQLRQDVSELNIDPKNIEALADRYFDRYNGNFSRTVMRIEFLKLAKIMESTEQNALELGYEKALSIAGLLARPHIYYGIL